MEIFAQIRLWQDFSLTDMEQKSYVGKKESLIVDVNVADFVQFLHWF